MRIVVASGKGGTGKTLVATSLAWYRAAQGAGVTYVDADVEEPNGHLFLKPSFDATRRLAVQVPRLQGQCDSCGRCQEACAFHALLAVKGKILVFPELCHSCGACVTACRADVLQMGPREIGTVREGRAGPLGFRDALLDVGEARATPLIEAVVRDPGEGLVLVDAPPGTSCPAVAAVRGSDLAVLVTEPTPFGLHDLDLAVRMCRALKVPPVVVVNRCDLGEGVDEALAGMQVPIVARIPFDRRIAGATARGEIAVQSVPGFLEGVGGLSRALESFLPEARS